MAGHNELVRYPHPDLDIMENLETQELFITSDKRQEKIKVFRPWDKTAFFRVKYESGKEVPGCTGQYTSIRNAVQAVDLYLKSSKKTPHAKQFEIFGPEPPKKDRPVLQRKKRVTKKHGSESSTADD